MIAAELSDSKRPVSEAIFEELQRRILVREYQPGDQLAIRDLAIGFGTSITPVRDALQKLAATRLIEMRPRGRSRVVEFTPRDIHELYQVRLMIEPKAAEMAADTLAASELENLQLLAEQANHHRRRPQMTSMANYLEAYSAGQRFHSAIVRGARNSRLNDVFEGLRVQLALVQALYSQPLGDSPKRDDEHQRIVDALKRRDGVAASRMLELHLEDSRDDVLRRMAERDSARPVNARSRHDETMADIANVASDSNSSD